MIKIFAQKLNIPMRTELINATLLADEIDFVAHDLIFFVNLSTISLHSIFLNLFAVMGTPKY